MGVYCDESNLTADIKISLFKCLNHASCMRRFMLGPHVTSMYKTLKGVRT
jgi:hypothetical protein